MAFPVIFGIDCIHQRYFYVPTLALFSIVLSTVLISANFLCIFHWFFQNDSCSLSWRPQIEANSKDPPPKKTKNLAPPNFELRIWKRILSLFRSYKNTYFALSDIGGKGQSSHRHPDDIWLYTDSFKVQPTLKVLIKFDLRISISSPSSKLLKHFEHSRHIKRRACCFIFPPPSSSSSPSKWGLWLLEGCYKPPTTSIWPVLDPPAKRFHLRLLLLTLSMSKGQFLSLGRCSAAAGWLTVVAHYGSHGKWLNGTVGGSRCWCSNSFFYLCLHYCNHLALIKNIHFALRTAKCLSGGKKNDQASGNS